MVTGIGEALAAGAAAAVLGLADIGAAGSHRHSTATLWGSTG